VTTRTTPTHNYYMTTALVKELAGKFQFRKHYMNIIPVSATINLNPLDYSAIPKGTKERKLPQWLYNSNFYDYDTSKTINANPYCITNRDIIGGKSSYSFLQDYYRIEKSEINTTLPIYINNSFTHDQLLADNSILHVSGSTLSTYSNANWTQSRGYPYSNLTGDICPAYNTTPALASFQEITTADYTADSTSKISVSENELFWDYMRNYIDPSKVKNYAIWGSPNISFGLQIAFENIAYVQNYNSINFNNNNYDKDSEFLLYVVSDQIGGVKNASGAQYVSNPSDIVRWRTYNRCLNATVATSDDCGSLLARNYSGLNLPSNSVGTPTRSPFQFTHFWWDSAYNVTSAGCFANVITDLVSCDIFYSAHPEQVVHNFYNIINYSIDLKYNKNKTKSFKRPKVYFIDTGSGKADDECQASNKNQSTYTTYDNTYSMSYITQNALQYTDPKPCMAYAEMAGYKTNYPILVFKIAAIVFDYEGGIITMGGGLSKLDEWIDSSSMNTVPNIHASGFDKVFAYKFVQKSGRVNRNIDKYAGFNLPIDYYNSSYKLQLKSHPNSSATYDTTVNNTANAASIAKYVVQQSLLAQPILRPY
jgi:hypothetical protein